MTHFWEKNGIKFSTYRWRYIIKNHEGSFFIFLGTKGIGKEILKNLASLMPNGSHFIFTGRNQDSLQSTENELLHCQPNHFYHPLKLDLGNLGGELQEMLKKLVEQYHFCRLYVVFSAFQLGFCGPVVNLQVNRVGQYFHTNVTSLIEILQGTFLKKKSLKMIKI